MIIYACVSERSALSAKVRAFIDYIAAAVATDEKMSSAPVRGD